MCSDVSHERGLPREAIQIVTDEWGIPHVRAANAADAFFGQGYAQAQLRLFQMDLWRRRGLGLLSEVLGETYLRLDIAARTFLARHDLQTEFAAFPDRDRERIEAFVAGINCWVRQTRADLSTRPIEFKVLGYEPSEWTAGDLLSIRIHAHANNAEQEVARSRTLSRFGPGVERIRSTLEPERLFDRNVRTFPVIDDDVLRLYREAHEPVVFDPGIRHSAGARRESAAAVSPAESVLPDGSNNWALSGSRTATGRPIVANHPHRVMTVPSLRVLIHVSCPEFDVIGMQEPYMPGILAGHNGHVAFGVTIAPADLEDLYVYELHPTDDDQYRYGGGWERMQVVVDAVPVAGQDAVNVEIRYTRHGPVLKVDPERRSAVALRATWLEPGMAPYLASIESVDASTAADFIDRLAAWRNPVLNHVVADVNGSVAWQVAGHIPNRPNWDGLLPVPGDGSCEWRGFRTAPDLPGRVDPVEGWVRSANQFNLSEDPEWTGRPTSFEWYAGFRARRLATVLPQRSDWSVQQVAALQNDYVVEPAEGLMPYLSLPFANADAEFARAEILAWDRRMTTDSRAAALFDRWLYTELPRVIRTEAARRAVTDEADSEAAAAELLDPRLLTLGDARIDIQLLSESLAWSASDTFTSTHDLVCGTLALAVAALREQCGADAAAWTWGGIHSTRLVHPLAAFAGDVFARELVDTGSRPKAGSSDTLGVSFGAAGVQTLGAATRIVIDVGDWDSSVCINSPGQDGAIGGLHSQDLFESWLADGYVPLLYSRRSIDQHTESTYQIPSQSRTTTTITEGISDESA